MSPVIRAQGAPAVSGAKGRAVLDKPRTRRFCRQTEAILSLCQVAKVLPTSPESLAHTARKPSRFAHEQLHNQWRRSDSKLHQWGSSTHLAVEAAQKPHKLSSALQKPSITFCFTKATHLPPIPVSFPKGCGELQASFTGTGSERQQSEWCTGAGGTQSTPCRSSQGPFNQEMGLHLLRYHL